jgi:hypothetical protein
MFELLGPSGMETLRGDPVLSIEISQLTAS